MILELCLCSISYEIIGGFDKSGRYIDIVYAKTCTTTKISTEAGYHVVLATLLFPFGMMIDIKEMSLDFNDPGDLVCFYSKRLCIKQMSSDFCVGINLFLLKTTTLYGQNDKDRSQTEMRTPLQPIYQHRPLSRFKML